MCVYRCRTSFIVRRFVVRAICVYEKFSNKRLTCSVNYWVKFLNVPFFAQLVVRTVVPDMDSAQWRRGRIFASVFKDGLAPIAAFP